eukprot:CAMPEP_0172307166 /NCGR_PEP_ID=MMETSP1058-20130122/8078_1 /TAXON_ID=83371 /ORGANISM="Detonula confervacea, Strain CCMP 353" /LENGTH=225 /DNA_ID=CAMNT_0013019255 /DNA_START=63 /DNA_END=740 /DNA_ORIENTATION=-
MSAGGLYKPWSAQKIRLPQNGLPGTCRFADLSKPLPDPPKGQMWVQDESSREWKLLPVVTATADAVAVAHRSKTDGTEVADASGNVVCTAAPVAVEYATPIKQNDTAAGIRYHDVLPTDTFQGICLRYKVTPTELRRANNLLGSNLKLAPEKLVIPSNNKNQRLNFDGTPTKEEQIASLVSKVSRITKNKLSYSEARAYLDIQNWDMNDAIENVREDFGWSSEHA